MPGPAKSQPRSRSHRPSCDATERTRYHLLDVGREIYGDCVLCVFPKDTVLIDGGHAGNFTAAGQKTVKGYAPIPRQLAVAIGGEAPFRISLLVVTHCHSDHIGCLPELVKHGVIDVEWALVADEKRVGWGGGEPAADPAALASEMVLAGLLEEPCPGLSGDALVEQLAAAAARRPRYEEMLRTLAERGTRVLRHGWDDTAALEARFKGIGLHVLGPTKDQLDICQAAIEELRVSVYDAAPADGVSVTDAAALYEQVIAEGVFAGASGFTAKGAINDTSIVLTVGGANQRALFGGDMQFSAPEVRVEINGDFRDLGPEMAALLQKVHDHAPYRLVKLSHHTSYNGLNRDVLEAWKGTPYVAHSGGTDDAGHPDPETLALLRATAGAHTGSFQFGRTDRNGHLVVDPAKGFVMPLARGRLNDFSVNRPKSTTWSAGERTIARDAAEATPPPPGPDGDSRRHKTTNL